MLGGEQAKAMTDAWTEGMQRMWETWADNFTSAGAVRPPSTADPWTEAGLNSLRAWFESVPYTNNVVGRLLPGPEPLKALFGATVAVWEAVARQVTAGMTAGNGQGALRAYAEELQKLPFRLPEAGTAFRDLTELWSLYVEEVQKLCHPWLEATSGVTTDPLDPTAHESGLVRFADLSWDVFERTFGRLLQSPSVGFTRELNEKLFGAFSSWLEFRRANLEYQVAVSTALARSTTQFLQELGAKAARGEAIGGLRELLRLWGDTLDEILIESFRSEEYAEVQGRLVKAAMAYRLREREAMDVMLKISHIPTRRDIDDVSRTLYELRKEVRGLSRTATNGRAGARDAGETAVSRSKAAPAKPATKTKPTRAKTRAKAGTSPAKAQAKPKTTPAKAETKAEPAAKAETRTEPAAAKAETRTEPAAAKAETRTEPAAKAETKPETRPETRPEPAAAKAEAPAKPAGGPASQGTTSGPAGTNEQGGRQS